MLMISRRSRPTGRKSHKEDCSIYMRSGFGSNILAMSEKVSKNFADANDAMNVKNPSVGWIMAFLFIISFIGLFCIVPLRKIMILKYKLTYPTGTATAHLINNFHTPQGAMLARMQVSLLFKSIGASFIWSLFKWFYEVGKNCGFGSFPTFGMKAFRKRFYFDFSGTYVGVGDDVPSHHKHLTAIWIHHFMGNYVALYQNQEGSLVSSRRPKQQPSWTLRISSVHRNCTGARRRPIPLLHCDVPDTV